MFKKMVMDLGDGDYPLRTILIDMYTRIIDNRLYDHLQYPFCIEYDSSGAYIQLRDRRPSAPYNFCRMVVDDSVSLTFGSDHFPELVCKNKDKTDFLNAVIDQTKLNLTMIEAATWGSVGSIAVLMRIMKGRVNFETKRAIYLTPTYSTDEPDQLILVTEKYKVTGKQLVDLGYTVPDENVNYWFMKTWDDKNENWYIPWKVFQTPEEKKNNPKPKIDKKRSKQHDLGFIPILWIKNLPLPGSVDGECTFKAAINIMMECDYQLSQGGRGLKYSSDPTTVLKLDDPGYFNQNNSSGIANSSIYLPDGSLGTVNSPQTMGITMGSSSRAVVRSANNALTVGKDDSVELLEISGQASKAVLDYVRGLREFGIELTHGNRANADKVNAAQSGKAQKEMNQALIWLSDKLRVSYGGALLQLLEMVVKASHVMPIIVDDVIYSNIDKKEKVTLKWPQWYPNTPQDNLQIAQTMQISADAKQLSQETAVRHTADTYGIKDIDKEIKLIEADQAKLMEQAPKIQEVIKA